MNRISSFLFIVIMLTIITSVSAQQGALNGLFSVSETKQVRFSQGNLQYQPSTNTWRFADNQYEIIGNDNNYLSSMYSGWVDLFGWGTSGYKNRYPYNLYEGFSSYDCRNNITNTNYDWGTYNKISNGGNKAGLWRVLTFDEWQYMIDSRPNANLLRGVANVNGINGFILLPDHWTLPSGLKFCPSGARYNDSFSDVNNYNSYEWSKMQAAGAVFLACAGIYEDKYMRINQYGYYWTGTEKVATEKRAHHFLINEYGGGTSRDLASFQVYKISVRLVQNVAYYQQPYAEQKIQQYKWEKDENLYYGKTVDGDNFINQNWQNFKKIERLRDVNFLNAKKNINKNLNNYDDFIIPIIQTKNNVNLLYSFKDKKKKEFLKGNQIFWGVKINCIINGYIENIVVYFHASPKLYYNEYVSELCYLIPEKNTWMTLDWANYDCTKASAELKNYVVIENKNKKSIVKFCNVYPFYKHPYSHYTILGEYAQITKINYVEILVGPYAEIYVGDIE